MRQLPAFALILASTLPMLIGVATNAPSVARATVETAPKVIASPSGAGRFDWMFVDAHGRKLLAAHRDAGALDIVDLDSGAATSVKVGHVQGVDMDETGHYYFAGDEQDQLLVLVDASTQKMIRETPTPGPIDALAWCPKNGLVYACHDDGTDVWAIDPFKGTGVVATIDVGGAPEFIEFDKRSGRLYQNVKSTNSVAVIDPATNKVVASYSTMPAEGPHGLAIDSATGHLFTAGRNGKLVELDLATGKQLAVADIAPGVDQIAMDHTTREIYCACKGTVSVVHETPDGMAFVKNIPTHAGAHTIAVDEKKHQAWVCYGDKTSASIERLDLK